MFPDKFWDKIIKIILFIFFDVISVMIILVKFFPDKENSVERKLEGLRSPWDDFPKVKKELGLFNMILHCINGILLMLHDSNESVMLVIFFFIILIPAYYVETVH